MPANKGDGRRERKFSSLCVLQHREPEVPNVGWDVSYQELFSTAVARAVQTPDN
uniref:Uncharacterized protein n=1 Tax=Anguilla anguilla TaxID=7936 RepID=A0A0E9T2G8_ANGAN